VKEIYLLEQIGPPYGQMLYGCMAYLESPQNRQCRGNNSQRSGLVGLTPEKNECPQRGHCHFLSFESIKNRIEKDMNIWIKSREAGSSAGNSTANINSVGPNSIKLISSQSARRRLYLFQASWKSSMPFEPVVIDVCIFVRH
jgi:hypothetical protein